jgi:hypothetical protein
MAAAAVSLARRATLATRERKGSLLLSVFAGAVSRSFMAGRFGVANGAISLI